MIRSAVRTTLRSLLRSDLVAELNQICAVRHVCECYDKLLYTHINMQKTQDVVFYGLCVELEKGEPWFQKLWLQF